MPDPDPAHPDQLRLVLPADPDYVRVARAATRGLGERLGLPWRAVEDLGLAVDETLVLLLRPEGSAGDVTFVFTVEPDRLDIDARSTAGRDQGWVDDAALRRFEALVGPVVDAHHVADDGTSVHLEKRRP